MVTGKNILVVMPVNEEQKQFLEKQGEGNTFTYTSYDKVSKDMVEQANVIIGNVDPFFLNYADQLEWLQLNSAGADPYVKEGVLKDNVLLTNATGAYGQSVAEHMLSVLFSIQKKLYLYRDNQNQCRWQDEGNIFSLQGGTLLVLGLGDIGMYFARLMKKFDYHVIGVKRRIGEVPEGIDEVHTLEDLDELLPKADVVFSVLPDSKNTRNIFNLDTFEKMKKSAVLLNAGRGTAVNTEDLCQALIQGKIRGAGIDVTDPEPLQSQHKLWNMPNLVITPHIAGDFHHPATLPRIIEIAAENLRRYFSEETLNNIVDKETGTRK